jgi:hypothetical protein
MGKHATVGTSQRSAPAVKASVRETPAMTARRGIDLAGPVIVTRFTPVLDSATVQEARYGALKTGITTIGTNNIPREWRVVRNVNGTFIRAEYRVKGGLVTVRKVNAQGFKGWMGFLTTGGRTVPVAAVTASRCIEPHRIQDETRRIALRNAAQIGHGEL